jgi:arylsulfatase A-like enzyme
MKGGKSALWTDENIVDVLTSEARSFIDRSKNEPFFLYFATPEIHVPRMPNPRFIGKTGMGPRGDSIVELDWSVGEILKALDRNGLTDNTLIIFSSDNGPVVDDGYHDQAVEKLGDHKPAGPLRGGKYSNFDGGTRVPFLVSWAGHVKPDSQSSALVSQVDLLSSLATLSGQPLPDDAAPDSMNVLPALLGKSPQGRRELVEDAGVLSLVDGDWKLIQPSDRPAMNKNTHTELGNAPEPQLYNLANDPGEKNNVATQQPQRVQAMLQRLAQIRAGNRTRP